MRYPSVLLGTAAAVALIGASSSAGAAPAAGAPAARPSNQCFLAGSVDGFSKVDDRNVDVTVGPRDVYRLTLLAPPREIDGSMRIGLESRGSPWICSSLDATVIVPSAVGPQRYPVVQMRKLSPDEIAAGRKARS